MCIVCQQVDEARGLIGALPDDFWTAIDSDAEHTDAVEDQLDEFGLHQKLLKAIEAMGKAEKVWQDGRKALAQSVLIIVIFILVANKKAMSSGQCRRRRRPGRVIIRSVPFNDIDEERALTTHRDTGCDKCRIRSFHDPDHNDCG